MTMRKTTLVVVLACLAFTGYSWRVQNHRMMAARGDGANISAELPPEKRKALATLLFSVNPATLPRQFATAPSVPAADVVLPQPLLSNTRKQSTQPFEESLFTQQTHPQFSFPHLQQESTWPRMTDTTMSSALIAQRVCPVLGVFLSYWLYFSPLPAIRSCVAKKSLGSFNPFPSFMMLIGASAWLGYGLSVQDVYISATNVLGTLLALAQLVFILPLMQPGRQLSQAQGIVLGGAACTILLWFRIIFSGASMMARSQALGIYATIVCIMLFASPLLTLTKVLRNRNSASILAPLAFSQTINCLMWTIYGAFAAKDVFVYGPNGIGLVLGLVQLALKAIFPSHEDASEVKNHSEAKMQASIAEHPQSQLRRTGTPQMVVTAQPKPKLASKDEHSWKKFTTKWEVHKFGGASLETADLYKTCGDLLLSQAAANGPESRVPTAAIVSACGGMTDALVAVVDASVDDFDKASELLQAAADRQKSILLEAVPGRPEITDPVIKNIDADQKGVLAMLTASSMMRGAPPQMLELVAGLGEVWSAQTLSAYLSFTGVKSAWVDARDVLIVGESGMSGLGEKGQALDTITPEWDTTDNQLQEWWENTIGKDAETDLAPFLIITGFVCSTPSGRPTTLKRSGSDYSATIFAKVLGASRVTMWKNVNGVYTADPRRVPAAYSIKDMTFDEAMELAYFGGQVLHPTAMVPCIEKRIPVYVKNVFNPSHPGTCVYGRGDAAFRWEDQGEETINPQPVTAITSIEKVSLITIAGTSFLGTPGVARRLMEALGQAGVNVILASQGSSEASITVAVDASDGQRGVQLVRQAFELELARNDEARCFLVEDCSILAIIGEGMKSTHGISGKFFRALGLAKVNVVAIAQGSSERNVSAVVPREDLSRALRAVHAGVALSELQVAVAVIGAGRVATGLLNQLYRFQANNTKDTAVPALQAVRDLSFDIRCVCDSKRMVNAENGVSLEAIMKSGKDLNTLDWTELFGDESVQDVDYDKMTEFFDSDEFPHKVVIDCTDSDNVPNLYAKWLERGIHVVSANKNGCAGPLPRWKECISHRAQWLYESAAGSQLPVISLVRDMFQTGDRIHMVSGVISGTLSFVFTTLSQNPSMAFSEAVQLAVEKNLTEFNCEQDFSGKDTARKALIIARELGLELELEDVTVESLLPASFVAGKTNDDIITILREQVDERMDGKLKAARENQERLLYVAEIDAKERTVWIGLKSFAEDAMPFVLREAETAITFVTERNPASTPFVLRAPGAGSEVTATGAFADLLRLSKNLSD